MKIVWAKAARADLRALHKFIARDSSIYANRMVAKILVRVEKVAHNPKCGHPVHEYPEGELREVHEPPYRIIYRWNKDVLEVVTLVHFKQRHRG